MTMLKIVAICSIGSIGIGHVFINIVLAELNWTMLIA